MKFFFSRNRVICRCLSHSFSLSVCPWDFCHRCLRARLLGHLRHWGQRNMQPVKMRPPSLRAPAPISWLCFLGDPGLNFCPPEMLWPAIDKRRSKPESALSQTGSQGYIGSQVKRIPPKRPRPYRMASSRSLLHTFSRVFAMLTPMRRGFSPHSQLRKPKLRDQGLAQDYTAYKSYLFHL